MKCLTLVIHEAAKQDLIDLLREYIEFGGFTITACEGHSRRTASNPFETERDRVLGYVPRVRLDILLPDEAVRPLMRRLTGCDSCVSGLGVWWVSPVDDSGFL